MRTADAILQDYEKLLIRCNASFSDFNQAQDVLNVVRVLRREMKEFLNINNNDAIVRGVDELEKQYLKLFPIAHPARTTGANQQSIAANAHVQYLDEVNKAFDEFNRNANASDLTLEQKKELVRFWEKLKNITRELAEFVEIQQIINKQQQYDDVHQSATLIEAQKKLTIVEKWPVIQEEINNPGMLNRVARDERQFVLPQQAIQQGLQGLRNQTEQPTAQVTTGETLPASNLPPLSFFDSKTPLERAQFILSKSPASAKDAFDMTMNDRGNAVTKITNNASVNFADLTNDADRTLHIKNLERMLLAFKAGKEPGGVGRENTYFR